MQKVLRHNLFARNQELRRARKKLFEQRKEEEKSYERWSSIRGKAFREQVRTERRNRREDWITGPLAPNRDSGLQKGAYGTVHQSQIQSRDLPKYMVGAPWVDDIESNLGVRKEWEGEGNEGNIIVGDRVCVVRGAPGVVGQIGQVVTIAPEKGDLTVKDVNMVCSQSLAPTTLICLGRYQDT